MSDQDPDQQRRREDSWHLSKTVSVSQIITILVLGGSFVWQVALMDKRLSLLESKEGVTVNQHQGLDTRVALLEQTATRTAAGIDRIERKLDKMAEERRQ